MIDGQRLVDRQMDVEWLERALLMEFPHLFNGQFFRSAIGYSSWLNITVHSNAPSVGMTCSGGSNPTRSLFARLADPAFDLEIPIVAVKLVAITATRGELLV